MLPASRRATAAAVIMASACLLASHLRPAAAATNAAAKPATGASDGSAAAPSMALAFVAINGGRGCPAAALLPPPVCSGHQAAASAANGSVIHCCTEGLGSAVLYPPDGSTGLTLLKRLACPASAAPGPACPALVDPGTEITVGFGLSGPLQRRLGPAGNRSAPCPCTRRAPNDAANRWVGSMCGHRLCEAIADKIEDEAGPHGTVTPRGPVMWAQIGGIFGSELWAAMRPMLVLVPKILSTWPCARAR